MAILKRFLTFPVLSYGWSKHTGGRPSVTSVRRQRKVHAEFRGHRATGRRGPGRRRRGASLNSKEGAIGVGKPVLSSSMYSDEEAAPL